MLFICGPRSEGMTLFWVLILICINNCIQMMIYYGSVWCIEFRTWFGGAVVKGKNLLKSLMKSIACCLACDRDVLRNEWRANFVEVRMNVPSRHAIVAFAIKLFCLAMILPISSSLKAQSFYGSIVGTVMDTSGAVIPEATVTVTNVGTNQARDAQSDAEGKFNFVNLLPAVYKVEVTKANFKHFVGERLTVEVGAVVRVDPALEVGAVNQTVEVSETALLQTDTSTMGQEISGAQVQETPLNGRNVMNLIALAPGVVPGGSSTGDTGLNQGTRTSNFGWGNYQIGGAIQGQSATYVDGGPINVLGGNPVALVVTQDAIQEFNVATSNAGADFGRFAGGVVSMTTKSGTNAFHGSAYEYFRNAVLNANDFFSNRAGSPRAKWNQNQYGVVVNGPIKKDKAFFLFTWEGFAAITGSTGSTNVPTQAMQNGVFTDPITDPLGNCNIVNDPAAGTWTITNLYQGACGDPLNKILKTYYPLPNSSIAGANWFLTTPITNHQNQYNGRIDYAISDKQRIFGRYTYWTLHDTGHTEFNNANGWPTADGHVINETQGVVLGDSYTFNPTNVLDVRVNYLRETNPNYPESTSVDQSQFGPTYAALAGQMSLHVLPAYNASGGLHNLYNLGNFTGYQAAWYNTYGVNANLIKIIGAHSLKIGTELRLMDVSGTAFDNTASGQYSYSTQYTGDEWASFLMGYPTQAKFGTINKTAGYNYYQAYYVSDTWQAKQNLTLNLGLRWELPGAVAERNNKAAVLLPNAVDPYTGITGTLTLVDSPLYRHRPTVLPKFDLFAPRVGFAYRIQNDTVLRGGYGISYLPPDLSAGTLPFNSLVNAAQTQVNNSPATPIPLQTILDGILAKGINQPVGRSDPSFVTQYVGSSISGPVPYQPFPYVQQWNLTVSHEFKGNWMAEVGYAGLKATHLPGISIFGSGRNLDELSSQYYSLGAALATNAFCPAVGETISVGQCLRPYPFYTGSGVTDTAQYYAYSNYNSLQARMVKRFGAGGILAANYTWSRNLGNTDTQNGYLESKATLQGGNGSGLIQDFNNLNGEYSLLSFNVPQRVVINYVLPLPFGKEQKFANSLPGPANMLVSGWQVSGITIFQSGFPLFFTTSNNNLLTSNFGAGQLRPNVVPDCNKKVGGSDLARVNKGMWFNAACFVFPTSATDPTGLVTFGNESRVDGTLSGAGIKNWDFSAVKSTKLWESVDLQFRAEFFNIFNRVQFAPPVAQQGSSSIGTVNYQVNNPRQIQFSLRVNF